MKKTDILTAVIIAELDAWLFMAIFRNIGLDFVPAKFTFLADLLLKFLPIILPVLAVAGIIVADLIGRKIFAVFQLYKFLLTGTLNTFIDLGVFNFLMWAFSISVGLPLSIFKGISFSSAVVNSYFLNKFWTFKKKETKIGPEEFSKFYLITGIGFLLNVGIFTFIVNFISPQFGLSEKIWANVGAITATICVCSWNFLCYKFIVFKK